jgi:hypothetical protein
MIKPLTHRAASWPMRDAVTNLKKNLELFFIRVRQIM